MEQVPRIGTGILKLNSAVPICETKFEFRTWIGVPLRVIAAGLVTPVIVKLEF